MQEKKNGRKSTAKKEVKKSVKKEIKMEEFLREGGLFDEEDEDEVTDDTLQFLSLDDETIEAYQREHKRAASRRTASVKKQGRQKGKRRKEEDNRYYASGDDEADGRYYEADETYDEDESYYEYGSDTDEEEVYYEEEEYYGEGDEIDGTYNDEDYEAEYYEADDEDYEAEYYEADDEDYEAEHYEADDEDYEAEYYEADDEDYEAEYYEADEDGMEYYGTEEDGMEYYEIEGEEDDYEDDEEDEEYDEYDDEEDGIFVRIKDFLADLNTLDMVVAVLGVVVAAGVIVTGGLYINAKSVEKQAEGFASVGEQVEGISVIGESGLVAVAESARLGSMVDLEEEPQEEQEQEEEEPEETDKTVEVTLNLTSIQSDLKIKFVNKKTGKLVGGVPFAVEVAGGAKTMEWKDENEDGIIYHTEVPAGEYSVKVMPFESGQYADYKLPTSASSVKVTDTITYKKVEVADEVKTEAEVNAAVEDTAVQETVVESVLKDTVEWVESTKTPIGEEKAVYEAIDKKNIPDPWTVSSAYRKLVDLGKTSISGNDTDQSGGQGSNQGGNQDSNTPKPLKAELDKKNVELKKGENTTIAVKVTEGSAASITWKSSDDRVASVDGSGKVTAKEAGSATVTATVVSSDGAKQDLTCAVTVKADAAPPQELKAELDKKSVELKKGESTTLTVKVTGGSAASITWKSGNDKIVSVDGSGKVTAKEIGSATVTATVTAQDGKKQDLACTVTVKSTYGKVTISGAAEVVIGQNVTLTVQIEPKDGKITWSSDNEKIAKVDSKGVVTGVAEGTVNIKAACTDAPETFATHKMTVKKSIVDGKAKLKDKDGNQMYYLNSSGEYKEATYDDYKKYDKFFKKKSEASEYKYTGWQTIDGHVYFFDKEGKYVTGEQVIQGAKYNFGSDGKMSSGSGSMGIDVSKWNGNIDWNAVKNSGVSYVIIRCGYRGSSTGALIEDPKFRSNIKGAKAAGLKVGIYFFSQAVNEVEAVEEASMAVNLASGYGLNYPIFLDVESSGGRGDGISKETRTEVCKAFCATVQNSGYSAGVYANKNWFSEKINTGSLTSYKIWLAQYASAPTYSATRYDMWQYSSKGKVSGINGDVDMNISYMNY